VPGSIFLAFLAGYAPPWRDVVMDGVRETFPQAVEPLTLDVDLAPAFASDRAQYHATLILAALLRHLPDERGKILGVTSVDLYIPVLTFVFGQAQLDGPGAVVSTFRLRNEFYGLPPDEGVLVERTIKEAVHELGHGFGLVHCPEPACVMHASSYVEEVDTKPAEFCPRCQRTLMDALPG